LDSCYPGENWDSLGKTHLEIAARGAEQSTWAGTGLASGIAGLGFAAWQLSRAGARYPRLLALLDETIAGETIQIAARVRQNNGLNVGDFDVISGLSGIGAYLLARYPERSVKAALALSVEALITLVQADGPQPRWHTPPHQLFDDEARQTYPYGNLNCGLAHGLPGILAFLSLVRIEEARLESISFERLDQAITTAADWIAAHRLDDNYGVNWPAAVPLEPAEQHNPGSLRVADPSRAPGGPARAAWCYGAPGVARTMWLAGQALGRRDYKDLALSAMEAVFRRPVPARGIDSPTFCHGVAGLLGIALRFARETRAPLFLEQTGKLTEQLISAFDPASLLGFRNLEYANNMTDQPGLLDGAAGVALVLISVASGIEPSWDRAFLLS
jgi:lantibiotic biosynthesis protein